MKTRTAIFIGGTRGLGKATVIAPKADGNRAAAVYQGNDKAAQEFRDVKAIPVYKWPGLQERGATVGGPRSIGAAKGMPWTALR